MTVTRSFGQATFSHLLPDNSLEKVLKGYLDQLASDRIKPNNLVEHLSNWFRDTVTSGNEALATSEERLAQVLRATTVRIGTLTPTVQVTADEQHLSLSIEELVNGHGEDPTGFCLAPILWEWTQTWPMTGVPDRRARGILPAPFATRTSRRMEETHLPCLEPSSIPGPFQTKADQSQMAYLPGLEPDEPPTPALILALFDHGGGQSVAANGPARPSIRIFVEAILDVPARSRDGQVRHFPYQVREITGRWLNWDLRHYRRKALASEGDLRRALDEVHNTIVPLGNRGGWYRPLSVVAMTGETLDDQVFISTVLPTSKVGPPIDRKILRELGRRAGLAYRAYISVVFDWDHYGGHHGKLVLPTQPEVRRNPDGMIVGKTGEVLLNKRNRPVESVHDFRAVPTGRREPSPWRTRYPEYSIDDLVRLAYPAQKLEGMDLRNARRRAKEAFKIIRKVGGCYIEELGEGRAKRFRVMPPDHT